MKKYIILLFLLPLLYACHNDEEKDEPVMKYAKQTVLVYMAAENNLTDFATEDLNEMKTGSRSLKDDQNLIVYVDQANTKTTPYLARVKGGELVDTVYMKEGLAADPTVLENTISYVREHYPAYSYGLVMWGHASGWLVSDQDSISAHSRAYGGSTGDNTSTGSGRYWMNIVPMAKAIANGLGDNQLRFIMGDCCSFGCMEVAYELRNTTEYVIGSPAEIPDMGAPFDLIIPDMFKETEDFYEYIIDDYYNYYSDVYIKQPNTYYNKDHGDLAGYSVPLAAIKTSELDILAEATARLLNTISEKISYPSKLNLEGMLYYGYAYGFRFSYDMYQVLKNNTSEEDFNVWYDSFSQAIPYSVFSQKWMTNFRALINDMENFTALEEDCGSVSMFFPSSYYEGTIPDWNKAILQYQWNNTIKWEQYGW